MEPENFRPRFSARHRVLLLTAGKRLDQDIYMSAYHLMKRFMAAHGPCSTIFDLSAVTEFDMSYEFLREIVDMPTAVPIGMKRLAVAPNPVVFGSGRVLETLRSGTAAPINIYRTLDEAYAVFGATAADFTDTDIDSI